MTAYLLSKENESGFEVTFIYREFLGYFLVEGMGGII
jgi:hypothetical protein